MDIDAGAVSRFKKISEKNFRSQILAFPNIFYDAACFIPLLI